MVFMEIKNRNSMKTFRVYKSASVSLPIFLKAAYITGAVNTSKYLVVVCTWCLMERDFCRGQIRVYQMKKIIGSQRSSATVVPLEPSNISICV